MGSVRGESLDVASAHARLSTQAARGVFWLALQTGGAKVVSLLAQVVLAWLLTRDDFGLLAKTYMVAAFPGLLYLVGLRETLLRRDANRVDRWAGPATWMAGTLGVASMLLMLGITPMAGAFFNDDGAGRHKLFMMVAALAASAPLMAIGNVPLAQLQARLRFKAVSVITFVHLACVSVPSVILALAGFGAYSFVLPAPLAALVRLALLWRLAPPRLPFRPHIRRLRYLSNDVGNVLTARALAMVTEVGDYLVLGRFHPDFVVGVYYFAFNLSLQTAMLLALNLDGVLMPVFAKLKDDPRRQRDAFLGAAKTIALVGIPVCVLQAAVAGPLMRLIFDAKWRSAIPVLQVLSIGMALRVVTHPAQSLIRAQGRFPTLVRMNGAGATLFLLLTTSAASLAPDESAAAWTALAVAAFFAIEGPAYVLAAVSSDGTRWREVAEVYVAPFAMSAAAALLALVAKFMLPEPATRIGQAIHLALICVLFAPIYLAGIRWARPYAWADVSDRIRRWRGKARATEV